jgi:hypothetical protein
MWPCGLNAVYIETTPQETNLDILLTYDFEQGTTGKTPKPANHVCIHFFKSV